MFGLSKRKRTETTTTTFEQLHKPVPPLSPAPSPAASPKRQTKVGRVLGGIPIVGELFQIGPLIPKIAEIFQDKSGRMSSKRFGAGAFVIAGITLVSDGSSSNNPMQFWGGIALCAMGVVLFAFTKWEPGEKDTP